MKKLRIIGWISVSVGVLVMMFMLATSAYGQTRPRIVVLKTEKVAERCAKTKEVVKPKKKVTKWKLPRFHEIPLTNVSF